MHQELEQIRKNLGDVERFPNVFRQLQELLALELLYRVADLQINTKTC